MTIDEIEKEDIWGQTWKDSILAGLELIKEEYWKASKKQGKTTFHSYHEGYAVLLEEVEEFWEHLKVYSNPSLTDLANRKAECVQIGAMALALIIHCEIDMTLFDVINE